MSKRSYRSKIKSQSNRRYVFIPKEVRKILDVKINDHVYFYENNNGEMVIAKRDPFKDKK